MIISSESICSATYDTELNTIISVPGKYSHEGDAPGYVDHLNILRRSVTTPQDAEDAMWQVKALENEILNLRRTGKMNGADYSKAIGAVDAAIKVCNQVYSAG